MVSGARLTVALQTQGATLAEFMERTGGLARGMGFLARFLCAIPESTQGTRFFKEPPAAWIALGAFTLRLGQILRQQAPVQDAGSLEPAVLKLSGPARERWKQYHDAVEAELSADGELADVRDVASKSADNAARLACLFHVFGHGPSGEISEQHMSGGCALATWYLHESRRLLMQHALPQGLRNAITLDRWMIRRCKAEGVDRIALRTLRQKAPRSVRDKFKLAGAIKELEGLSRARLGKDGKADVVILNPALLKS